MPDAARTHEIVLYTQGACEFSEIVRLHLESRGQRYVEKEVDRDPAAREELLALAGMATPVTVIDGEVVVGFDEETLDELLGFEPYNPPARRDATRLDE
jgi:glutaredoxin